MNSVRLGTACRLAVNSRCGNPFAFSDSLLTHLLLLAFLGMHLIDTSFEDLCILETERESQKINNYTRLVGGQDISSSINVSTAEISNSGIMRCTDCPRTSILAFSCLGILILPWQLLQCCATFSNCPGLCCMDLHVGLVV